MQTTETPVTWCADYSRAAGEQLCGTAKPVDLWLLMEYRGRWDRDVTANLAPAAQAFVDRAAARYPRIRVGLIKQIGRNSGPLAVFAALSHSTAPRLFGAEIESLDALASLDILDEAHRVDRKLFLVCTHGTHDRCCAKYGTAVMVEMQTLEPADLWQVSHIGGCRFAPNVVCLPHGIVYGRLMPGDCASVVNGYRRDELRLDRLRGRSCFPKPAQAAEHFLRLAHPELPLNGLALLACETPAPSEWRVVFQEAAGGRVYELMLSAVQQDVAATFKSCAAQKQSPRERFELRSCTVKG